MWNLIGLSGGNRKHVFNQTADSTEDRGENEDNKEMDNCISQLYRYIWLYSMKAKAS